MVFVHMRGGYRRGHKWRCPSSWQQNRLIHYVRLGGYPEAQLNWKVPIKGMRKKRWADVAIVRLKVDIEYQGQKTHSSPIAIVKDKIRTEELESMGWVVIFVDKYNWSWFFGHMKEIIEKAAKERKSLYPSSPK